MSVTNFLPSEFNGDQVISHFDLSPEHGVERAAMNFMFRMMKEEIPLKNAEMAFKYKEIAKITIEQIEFRFDLYRNFSEDFFFGEKTDYDSLSVAVICGQYVEHINAPYPCEEHDGIIEGPVLYRNDGIDGDTVDAALGLMADAQELLERGKPPIDFMLVPEAVFLAHILMFERLREIEADLVDTDDDDLITILIKELPAAKSFSRLDTELGRHLEKFITHIEQEISPYIPKELLAQAPPPSPAHEKPKLSLVPRAEMP